MRVSSPSHPQRTDLPQQGLVGRQDGVQRLVLGHGTAGKADKRDRACAVDTQRLGLGQALNAAGWERKNIGISRGRCSPKMQGTASPTVSIIRVWPRSTLANTGSRLGRTQSPASSSGTCDTVMRAMRRHGTVYRLSSRVLE